MIFNLNWEQWRSVGIGLAASMVVSTVSIDNAGAQSARSMSVQGVMIEIQPIFGYERVQKLFPTAHQNSRLFYGARATFGIPLVAAELEYIRGQDTEVVGSQSVEEVDDRIKLGIRSRVGLGSLLFLSVRAGGQAKRTTRTVTQAGVATVTTLPFVYHPYAGAALGGRLGTQLSIEGGMNVVFTNFPDMSANDYQATLGFTVNLKL